MANVQDQIAQARAAGYTDEEIAAKLSAAPNYGDKIKAASQAGYSTSDIISHLSGASTASQKQEPPPSQLRAMGQRMMSDIDQMHKETNNGMFIAGLGETALNAVTGLGASAVGGLRGLAKLAMGGTAQEATDVIRQTQNDYTYQPRQGVGKLGAEVLAAPIVAAKELTGAVGGKIGESIGGTKGRLIGEAIGDVLPDAVATIAGGRAAMRGVAAKPANPITERAAAPVNYDVPAYQRNGTKPVAPAPEPTPVPAPEGKTSLPAPPAPTAVPAPNVQVPAASAKPVLRSPLDAYAAAPEVTTLPMLNEPVAPYAPAGVAVSDLERFAANPIADAAGRIEPLANVPVPAASPIEPLRSPLDDMIAGNQAKSPVEQITAGLRDTSDIDQTLKQFGIEAPQDPIVPVLPTEAPQVAPAPVAPEIAPVVAEQKPVAAAPVERPATAAPETPKVAPPEPPAFDAGAASRFDPAQREANIKALQDIGLTDIRESAVNGDAAAAAREFQHGKITGEPAGQHWFDQFNRETTAMKDYAQGLVDETKGRTGLNEHSLELKGQDIAAPYDAARMYFEKAKKNLYNQANEASKGLPDVELKSLDSLLNTDSVFEGKAEKSSLRRGLRAYLREQNILDADGNMQPVTVKAAEGVRKYLNGEWSPQTAGLIGKIKGVLDDDVMSAAGGDIYEAARHMHQLEKQLLDNPNGIAKLMDSDPYTPINRNTPYEKIPDKIMALSQEQFNHIIDTYKNLPPELQPLAQQAVATLKAHYAERFLNAGTETGRGNPRQLWDAGSVRKLADDNSAKIPLIFDEAELAKISNMLRAGEILRVNPAYPGAAAQLANASKAGMMTHLLSRAGGGIGGAIGAFTAGPVGAGVGGLLGDAATAKLLTSTAERRALSDAQSAMVKKYEAPKPSNPIEAWEQEARH